MNDFLNGLQSSLEIASTSGHEIILLGDYNINILDKHEFDKLDIILKEHGLSPVNTTSPTRVCGTTETLIDNFSCENPKDYSYYISDVTFSTDHLLGTYVTNQKIKPAYTVRKS